MGHQRLGSLPRSREWRNVIALLNGGGEVQDVAAATAVAAERSMIDAASDPAVRHAFWLLTQIPLAARTENFAMDLRKLGLDVSDNPILIEVATAVMEAIDRQVAPTRGRTDYGELAQLSAVESIQAIVGRELPEILRQVRQVVSQAVV